MKKFQNKYRIDSARLKTWDYGNDAPYFVTICVQNHQQLLGCIKDGEMLLNPSGEMVRRIWLQIPEQFDYAQLGAFVVMPNHFHGIISIDKSTNPECEAENTSENPWRGGFAKEKNPMLNKNLSTVIRWFKGRATFEIRKLNPNFEWQSRFWDHIIRSNTAFNNIENYILNNPKKWSEDKFNPNN